MNRRQLYDVQGGITVPTIRSDDIRAVCAEPRKTGIHIKAVATIVEKQANSSCNPMSSNRTPTDVAHLNALLELISSSVQEIILTYNVAGQDVPALDSTDRGPFDGPETTPLALTKIIQVVEGACAQLCATIAPPGHAIINVRVLSLSTDIFS